MKKLYDAKLVGSLRKFLAETDADEIIMRTTRVNAGWDDVQFDARKSGFNVYIVFDKQMEAKHQFSECYQFVRK